MLIPQMYFKFSSPDRSLINSQMSFNMIVDLQVFETAEFDLGGSFRIQHTWRPSFEYEKGISVILTPPPFSLRNT